MEGSPCVGSSTNDAMDNIMSLFALWRYVEHTSCNHTDPTTAIRIVTSRIIWGQIIVWIWDKSRECKNVLLHAEIPFHFGYVMCWWWWWWWHWGSNVCLSQVNKRHHRPLCQKHTLSGMASTEHDVIISRSLPRSCSRTWMQCLKVDEGCLNDHQGHCRQPVQGNGYMHCRHSNKGTIFKVVPTRWWEDPFVDVKLIIAGF